MDRKAREAIKRYGMIERGGKVVAGVSGGADSVALLDFLCRLRGEWGLHVRVCHINHLLRGAESDRDEAFVVRLCGQYGVECSVFHEDVRRLAAENHESVEAAARRARYRRFEELARDSGARIATAHTLSDSLETAMLNLARGTGPRGLCGIPPVRGRIVRPLILCTRADIEDYCHQWGLCYMTDSTNDGEDYARNRIRHRAVPALYSVNSSADAAFLRLREILGAQQDYLREQARALLRDASQGTCWRVEPLREAHPALRNEAVAMLMRENGLEPSGEWVVRLSRGLTDGAGAVMQLPGGLFWWVDGDGGQFGLEKKRGTPETVTDCAPVADGTTVQIGRTIVSFLCDDYEHYKETENNKESLLKNAVDYDKIMKNVVVRTRRPGDRFSMPGRPWSKTLKKLYNEYGVPCEERGRRLVLADSGGVLWVEGFGADARAAAGGGTRRVLVIRTQIEAEGSSR